MAETRSIRADYTPVACDVCGRTLLRGERAEAFLAGGTRRQVCVLCTPRAQHEGWIREAGMDGLETGAGRGEGGIGRSFLGRLRGHRERAREVVPLEADAAAADADGVSAPPLEPVPEPVATPTPTPERRESARPSRQVRAVPTNADLKMQRALDVFNTSPFVKTVGGVARSLGPPAVCVRPLVDRPSVVTITVMWELSWYRFETDLSDEAGGVRRDAHGSELDELSPDEQLANAAADPRGALHLGAAAA